jgi:hypothetical protein
MYWIWLCILGYYKMKWLHQQQVFGLIYKDVNHVRFRALDYWLTISPEWKHSLDNCKILFDVGLKYRGQVVKGLGYKEMDERKCWKCLECVWNKFIMMDLIILDLILHIVWWRDPIVGNIKHPFSHLEINRRQSL